MGLNGLEVQRAALNPIPRNYIPTRSKDCTIEHARLVLSAQSPGAFQTEQSIERKLQEIKDVRHAASAFAISGFKGIIADKAALVGVRKKDGHQVGNFDETREAFGTDKYPSVSVNDLMNQQKNLFLALADKRDCHAIDLQVQFMNQHQYQYMMNGRDNGSQKKGGCFTRLLNQVKNDLKDKIRDASMKAHSFKVVLRNPTRREVLCFSYW